VKSPLSPFAKGGRKGDFFAAFAPLREIFPFF
jgi:hypothetical protein